MGHKLINHVILIYFFINNLIKYFTFFTLYNILVNFNTFNNKKLKELKD
jgi:hypothetical protein